MLTVEVRSAAAEGALARVEGRLRDLSEPMARIGQRLLADIHRNFREGGWYPRAWSPSRRVLKKGGQTLVDKGLLRRSMQERSGPDWAEAGSGLVYARIHQEGGTLSVPARVQPVRARKGLPMAVFAKRESFAKRKTGAVAIRFIPAHTVRMPARPFLPVSADGRLAPATEVFVREQIGDFVAGVKA
jgi:phage gpG-like protein